MRRVFAILPTPLAVSVSAGGDEVPVALDGRTIQDDWASSAQGSFGGTDVHSFNPETGKWDNRWLAGGSLSDCRTPQQGSSS